jgi:hypothetical protein
MAGHKGLLNESELKAATNAARLAIRNQEGLDLRGLVENRRKALEALASKPLTITPIPIWTAVEIDRVPLNIPFAKHIEPGNNWAQIDFETRNNIGNQEVDVSFLFGWQNPTDFFAIVSAECDLVLKGTGHAEADPTYWHGGHARLNLFGQLILATTPIPSVPGPILTINTSLNLDSGPGIGGGGSITNNADFSGMFHLSNDNQILVDPFDTVTLLVRFFAQYDVDHGQVILDFSSSDNSIMCPSVQVDLLTPPVARA